jgi:hypothetical protein
MTRSRSALSAITVIVAVYVVALPFALSLFSRTRDAEKLDNFYRPLMSEQGIDHFRSNLAIVNDGGTELYAVTLPKLQHDLGMNETQFNDYVAQNFPHVAAFLKRAPDLVKYLNPATEAVLAQKDNFHDADQFPIANVRMDLGPWALLLLGSVLVLIGILIRSWARALPVLAVLAIAVGLLFGPLLLGWFHETDAAEKVAGAARAPFSTAVANTVVDDIYKIDAAFTEMRVAMFPAIGRQLGQSPTETDSYLHGNFPKTMHFLDQWNSQLFQGAHDLSLTQIEYMDEFHNADATPYRTLPWLVMAPGAVLLIASGYVLATSRSPGGELTPRIS